MGLNASEHFLFALIVVSWTASASATPLVQNGDFEATTNGPAQLGYNTDAVGWSTSGYNFVFAPGTADTTGSAGQYGALKLWGPGDGSDNGLPASSPTGGNYVGADGAFQTAPISQTISGLTTGNQYAVSFWWAGAQQSGFYSPTTEQWVVSLGDQTFATPVVNNVSQGFTGWIRQTFTYTATSGTEVLSFLAVGTPSGVPPFALLDGVSAEQIPEPAVSTVMIGALGALAGLLWRRRRTRSA